MKACYCFFFFCIAKLSELRYVKKVVQISIVVCHSLSQGVAALFGPNSPYTAHHVQSICDSKEIPHIETRWDYRVGPIREQYSINLFPYPPALSKVSHLLIFIVPSTYSVTTQLICLTCYKIITNIHKNSPPGHK